MKVERSITEKIEFRLAQIRKWNPEVNAIVSMRQENEILHEAHIKEKLPIEEQGELHGEIIAIKDLLGHSSLSSTQVYTHLQPSKLKKVYKQAHPYGK